MILICIVRLGSPMEEMQYTITLEKEERRIAENSGCLYCSDAVCIYRKFCFHTVRYHFLRLLPLQMKTDHKKAPLGYFYGL